MLYEATTCGPPGTHRIGACASRGLGTRSECRFAAILFSMRDGARCRSASANRSARRRPVIDDELEIRQTIPMMNLGSEQRMNAPWHRRRRVKRDCGKALAAARDRELRVAFADAALIGYVEHIVERGRRKALAPRALAQRCAERQCQFTGEERAIAFVRSQ